MLKALSAFLGFLNAAPHPDDVAFALVDGPGSDLGAVAAAVAWAHRRDLVFLGVHGYHADEISGLQTLSLSADLPMPRAFHENEILIDSVADIDATYPSATTRESRWPSIRDRLEVETVVSAPITSSGVPVGVFTMHCAGDATRQLHNLPLLRALCGALGLWLTHPDSGVPIPRETTQLPVVVEEILTDRQRTILSLLAAGKTTSFVAATLGVSPSTVKQETQRTARMLGTPDRAATIHRARELGLVRESPR